MAEQVHHSRPSALGLLAFLLMSITMACTGYAQTPPPPSNCSQKLTTHSEIEVMDRPPLYSTQAGWQAGHRVASIPSGTTVFVCETKDVGFFLSKQRWLRIWRPAGWIYEPSISGATERNPFAVSLVERAFAQGTPAIPPLVDPLTVGSFLAMVLGMCAKNTFDYFKKPFRLEFNSILRQFIPPLLVSPVLFLGLIKNVSIELSGDGSLLMIFLFAFQNGFFWQDVLSRAPGRATKRA